MLMTALKKEFDDEIQRTSILPQPVLLLKGVKYVQS